MTKVTKNPLPPPPPERGREYPGPAEMPVVWIVVFIVSVIIPIILTFLIFI